jgi:hypothetical protein
MKSKSQILKLADKFCKADHCKASFYKGYREAQKDKLTREKFMEIWRTMGPRLRLEDFLDALGLE